MPFEQARDLLKDLVGIQVSKATARRATLQTGEAEAEYLKQELPQASAGADKQALSADGAFVHLVGGEWAEVKTVVMGQVTRNKRGEVCTRQISAFSRLSRAERFAAAAGGRLPPTWLTGLLHRLKHQGPARVLKHLAWLAAGSPSPLIREKLAYLQKREAHMQYPTRSGKQAGPLALGASKVETWESSKRVSKALACGFRRQNVNPMLVLRNAVCNRQWHQTWTTAVAHRQALRTSRRQADSQQQLAQALWFLVFWGVRVDRLSHPPVHAATSPAAPALVIS